MNDYSERQPLIFSRADLTHILYVVTPDSTGVPASPVSIVVGNGSGEIRNRGDGSYEWQGIDLPIGLIKLYGQEYPEDIIYDRNDSAVSGGGSLDWLAVDIGNSANPVYPQNTPGFSLAQLIIAPYDNPPAIVPGPAPVDGAKCLVEGYFEANTVVSFLLLPVKKAAKSGRILVKKFIPVRTDANGYFRYEAYRNDGIIPAGTFWKIVCSESDYDEDVYLDSPNFFIESRIV